MQTILKLALWVLLALPLLGQDPIIFGGKRAPVRSGAQGVWMMQNPNLAKYTEDFSNTAWILRSGSAKTTGVTDPFGGTTAVRITTTSGDGYLYQTSAISIVAGKTYTLSGYVRLVSGNASDFIIKAYDGTTAQCNGAIALTSSWARYSCSFSSAASSLSDYGVAWKTSPATGTVYEFAFYQINEGSTALPYTPTTDGQTYPNLVSGGASLQRGSTSGADTSDPTRRGVGLSFDSVDDRVSNLPSKGGTWTVINCSASHCYGVDSAGGSYIDGKSQAGATEFAIETAGGYSGTLTALGRWSRVLTAHDHYLEYFKHIRPTVNGSGGSLP